MTVVSVVVGCGWRGGGGYYIISIAITIMNLSTLFRSVQFAARMTNPLRLVTLVTTIAVMIVDWLKSGSELPA